MKKQYHRQITQEALEQYFQPSALETIFAANLGQDALHYQIGHDHFHYDGNSFAAGDAYVVDQRRLTLAAIQRSDALFARESFGRLTHTVQDLYAHSNYVSLWREHYPDRAAREIDPVLPELLQDPRLRSGRLYYPLEVFSFIAVFKPAVLPLLPCDSHAWMNMDDPERPGFEYAFAAAVKRTRTEYLSIAAELIGTQVNLFTGNPAQ